MSKMQVVGVVLVLVLSSDFTTIFAHDLQCEDHTKYIENGCNYCLCEQGNLTICTLMACDGEEFYEKQKNCEVNTEWKQDCNTCMCVKTYGTLCTVEKCASGVQLDDYNKQAEKIKKLGQLLDLIKQTRDANLPK